MSKYLYIHVLKCVATECKGKSESGWASDTGGQVKVHKLIQNTVYDFLSVAIGNTSRGAMRWGLTTPLIYATNSLGWPCVWILLECTSVPVEFMLGSVWGVCGCAPNSSYMFQAAATVRSNVINICCWPYIFILK